MPVREFQSLIIDSVNACLRLKSDEQKQVSSTSNLRHDVASAAIKLGVEQSTVRTWARKRVIPSTRVGREYRFLDSDLEEFIDQSTCKSVAQIENEVNNASSNHKSTR